MHVCTVCRIGYDQLHHECRFCGHKFCEDCRDHSFPALFCRTCANHIKKRLGSREELFLQIPEPTMHRFEKLEFVVPEPKMTEREHLFIKFPKNLLKKKEDVLVLSFPASEIAPREKLHLKFKKIDLS